MTEMNWNVTDRNKMLAFLQAHEESEWVEWPFEGEPYPNPTTDYSCAADIFDLDSMKPVDTQKMFSFSILDKRQKEGGWEVRLRTSRWDSRNQSDEQEDEISE